MRFLIVLCVLWHGALHGSMQPNDLTVDPGFVQACLQHSTPQNLQGAPEYAVMDANNAFILGANPQGCVEFILFSKSLWRNDAYITQLITLCEPGRAPWIHYRLFKLQDKDRTAVAMAWLYAHCAPTLTDARDSHTEKALQKTMVDYHAYWRRYVDQSCYAPEHQGVKKQFYQYLQSIFLQLFPNYLDLVVAWKQGHLTPQKLEDFRLVFTCRITPLHHTIDRFIMSWPTVGILNPSPRRPAVLVQETPPQSLPGCLPKDGS